MAEEINIDGFIVCAHEVAEKLGVSSAPEQQIRQKLQEILIGRNYLAALRKKIITKQEFCNVLIAHLQTLICRCAHVTEPSSVPDYRAIEKRISALIGQ